MAASKPDVREEVSESVECACRAASVCCASDGLDRFAVGPRIKTGPNWERLEEK